MASLPEAFLASFSAASTISQPSLFAGLSCCSTSHHHVLLATAALHSKNPKNRGHHRSWGGGMASVHWVSSRSGPSPGRRCSGGDRAYGGGEGPVAPAPGSALSLLEDWWNNWKLWLRDEIWELNMRQTEPGIKILRRVRTPYNTLRVLEVDRKADHDLAGARVLLLDRPGNIHSVYWRYKIWTESYYDIFATLPPLLPEGPVGILGLGAGTTARILHASFPDLDMHGWEIDPEVVDVARRWFGMRALEDGRPEDSEGGGTPYVPFAARRIPEGGSEGASGEPRRGRAEGKGRLTVHIGNALGEDVRVPGGFAGLLVDMYAEGVVIPPLQEEDTWRMLRQRLRPGGRIMVNCGGACVEGEDRSQPQRDGDVIMRETLAAMARAFDGEVSMRTLDYENGDNTMALTGPMPEPSAWAQLIAEERLRKGLGDWQRVTALV